MNAILLFSAVICINIYMLSLPVYESPSFFINIQNSIDS